MEKASGRAVRGGLAADGTRQTRPIAGARQHGRAGAGPCPANPEPLAPVSACNTAAGTESASRGCREFSERPVRPSARRCRRAGARVSDRHSRHRWCHRGVPRQATDKGAFSAMTLLIPFEFSTLSLFL